MADCYGLTTFVWFVLLDCRFIWMLGMSLDDTNYGRLVRAGNWFYALRQQRSVSCVWFSYACFLLGQSKTYHRSKA